MPLSITFLGHSGVILASRDHSVVIDPFLTGNPVATMKPTDVESRSIVVTHGHADHFGDTLAIARANDATVFCAWEVMEYLNENGHAKCEPGNTGGRIKADFGWVAFTPAFHSSSMNKRYLGQPMGAMVHIGGVTVYHCGDTALFSDMKLLAQIYKPQIAFIPVGDRFTMGPELAKMAAEFIKPKIAIPIHYKTFPGLLAEDISAFKPEGVTVKALNPGETWTFEG